MRLALRLTAALPLLWAFGACSSSPATAPSTSQAGDATARAGGGLLLGAYEATFALEAEGPVGSVEPLASQSRAGQKVGDLFALEVAEYFAGNPCGDCFKVSGLGLTAEGDLAVDLRMRHPFSSTATRSDLDVFDPRALILTDQAAITFAALDPVLGGRYGDIPAQPSLEAGLVLNADGYTARYDWIAEDPAVMGSPRGYDGTLNPYVDFFTEDNPDPVGVGEPIPNRRLAMASGADVKRLVISRQALAARGNQLSALLLIEVSYGAAAERRIAAPAPGSRTNPVYFLPAFNRKEPLVLQVTPPAPYVAGISEVGTVEVAICDWQAGLEGVGLENFAQPPDYTGTGQVPVTSTLTKVLLSAPALEMGVKTVTTFPDGTGTLADPWRVSFSVLNVLQPAPGTYYGLVAAQDSYHGTQTLPGLPAGGAPTAVGDFQTFQLVPFVVEPGSSNTPP
ncbi:MAG TPA: hypothetical protein VEI97_08585, partial [bacterium]|nr:hypothetical protein [bacterium]